MTVPTFGNVVWWLENFLTFNNEVKQNMIFLRIIPIELVVNWGEICLRLCNYLSFVRLYCHVPYNSGLYCRRSSAYNSYEEIPHSVAISASLCGDVMSCMEMIALVVSVVVFFMVYCELKAGRSTLDVVTLSCLELTTYCSRNFWYVALPFSSAFRSLTMILSLTIRFVAML